MATAMILAAGLGTRLRPLTDELPKPLMPVGDAAVLVHIERWLENQGIDGVVLNTHHLASSFGGVELPLPTQLVHEPSILGTAGGIANARPRLDPSAPLVTWNGDILAEIDVRALLSALAASGALAAWCVAPRPLGEGTVGLDDEGRVVRVRGVRRGHEARGGDYLGVAALSPSLLARLPPAGCMVGDVLGPLIEQGARVQAVEHRGPWDDIGSPASYLQANLRWLADRKNASFVGPGASCSAPLDRSVIGARAVVEGEGPLVRSVLWPGARARGPLTDCIVTAQGRVVQASPPAPLQLRGEGSQSVSPLRAPPLHGAGEGAGG